MINMPQALKAQRELTGQLVVTFLNVDDGKEFNKAFSELRAGVSWPIRAVKGYLCILGLLSGAKFGKADSLMLVYEKEYPNSLELATDAYNRAHDLRFQNFFTDRRKLEWQGFNFEFERSIRGVLAGRDIRLRHCPFAHDFVLGIDVIKRMGKERAFQLPSASVLRSQLNNLRPEDMDTDHPEYKFHAVNAFRYLTVSWEQANAAATRQSPFQGQREVSPMGWA